MTVVEYTYHNDSVNSSAISQIWYNVNTKALFVEFQDSGTIAGYSNVPVEVADEFIESGSIGRYYALQIKNNYHGIDTDGIEFREAFKPVRWSLDHINAPAVNMNTYLVTGTVSKTSTVTAASYDAAVDEYKRVNGDEADVTKIILVRN